MKLSAPQAYAAMYAFLEARYQMTMSDDLGALLGSMSLLEDGTPADPAIGSDWEVAVSQAIQGKVDLKLTLRGSQS
jgi:hypothetical protein